MAVTAEQVEAVVGQVATVDLDTKNGLGDPWSFSITGIIEGFMRWGEDDDRFSFWVSVDPEGGLLVNDREIVSLTALTEGATL